MEGESNSAKKVYSVCFLGLMMILGLASVFLFAQNHIPTISSDDTNAENTSAVVSFSEMNSNEEEESKENSSPNKQTDFGFVEKYRNLVPRIIDSTNQYLTELNPLSSHFKNVQKSILNYYYRFKGGVVPYGSDAFVILPNGYLAGCFKYCPSPKSQMNILDFSSWLADKNIPFVALITPDKSDDSITEFPAGVHHGYTQMMEEYKAFLDDNELAYIESKQILLAKNSNLYSWFYQSDLHWNVHAAYTMARETARYLNDELSVNTYPSALDDNNFELTVYPNCFLGDYGQKLGNAWKEDMEIFYPTTKTDFHIEIPESGVNKTGSFENTLIDRTYLEPNANSYGAFLGGDHPLVRIKNNHCQNGTRVLVIKLSFANSLCSYLASTVEYLDMIDPRHFDGSIRSYINQTEPDVVILCMGVVTEYDEHYLDLK